MQKLRARDRSDYDSQLQKLDARVAENREDIDRQGTYFDTFAQSIALITENINMQMEAENADVYDRNLMSLYGSKEENPTFMDHTTRKKDIMSYLKASDTRSPDPRPSDPVQLDIANGKVNYQDQREASASAIASDP
jgi:hypothetical protein